MFLIYQKLPLYTDEINLSFEQITLWYSQYYYTHPIGRHNRFIFTLDEQLKNDITQITPSDHHCCGLLQKKNFFFFIVRISVYDFVRAAIADTMI